LLRKIVAVFLALATVVMLFTACDGKEEPTTNPPIVTGDVVTTTEPTTTKKQTYVLTTDAGKTVPWQETTRFETTAVDYNTITFPTDVIDVPSVNMSTTGSSLPITVPTSPGITDNSTSPTLSTSTTKATTTTKKPTTTTQVEKFPTAVVIDSEGYNSSSGKLYLGVSPSGWSSDIKANSTSISVKVDGVTSTSKVTCSVTAAKNSDGMQEIVIDLSSQSVTSGSTVTYTIPEGFLVSKSGTQYNTSYTSSATI
jgi:hypothetical protein